MRSRLLLIVLALGAAVVGVVAAGDVVGTASNQCDNMAGTCIRERQQLAIGLVRLACVGAAAVSLAVLVLTLTGHLRLRRRLAVAALVVCAAIGVAALVAQPVDHLNNRWSGWLGV